MRERFFVRLYDLCIDDIIDAIIVMIGVMERCKYLTQDR